MLGAYAIASFATAPLFFAGSWLDAGVAGALGLLVGVLTLLAKKSSTYHNVFDVTTSVLVAFVAPNIATVVDPAAAEEVCNSVPSLWYILLFLLAAIAINITFGASIKQWPPMLIVGGVGYAVSYLCGLYLPTSAEAAPAISAFAIGVVGNLYARVTKQLAFSPVMGGVIILVPGSIGVRGALLLLSDPSGNGATFALNCVVVAVGITVGLFAATLAVYPTGKKRSVFLGL
ncbi:hypothetical protein BC938DRAFT_481748 [Jimgerdemannia flammicorona]|nr:hypothetical protein BC938DRAFT_481748 [Jimgerdemannia flammicorona]